jgi:hypothetical protein
MVMKKILLIILVVGTICSLICSRCELPMDESYGLYLQNNAPYSIRYYIAFGDKYAPTVYPDTSLPDTNYFGLVIKPSEKAKIYESQGEWKDIFNTYLPKDTLSVFIFHNDTIMKYPWKIIKDQYKILVRYDLSYQDFKKNNRTIIYP